MEKKYSNEDFANFIVEKVSNLSDANNPVYPYMVFCDCIDEFEDKTYLDHGDRCKILAMAFDLMDQLVCDGYFKEEKVVYYPVKKMENFSVSRVTEDGNLFVFETEANNEEEKENI